MSNKNYSFDHEFELEYNGDIFYIYVTGYKESDDHGYRYYTNLTSIKIFDNDGEKVLPSNPVYSDLCSEINDMDFEVEMQGEDVDDLGWTDMIG